MFYIPFLASTLIISSFINNNYSSIPLSAIWFMFMFEIVSTIIVRNFNRNIFYIPYAATSILLINCMNNNYDIPLISIFSMFGCELIVHIIIYTL